MINQSFECPFWNISIVRSARKQTRRSTILRPYCLSSWNFFFFNYNFFFFKCIIYYISSYDSDGCKNVSILCWSLLFIYNLLFYVNLCIQLIQPLALDTEALINKKKVLFWTCVTYLSYLIVFTYLIKCTQVAAKSSKLNVYQCTLCTEIHFWAENWS